MSVDIWYRDKLYLPQCNTMHMDYENFTRFMHEDMPEGDATSDLFVDDRDGEAYGLAKESFYLAGVEEIVSFFKYLDVEMSCLKRDGEHVKCNEKLFILKGKVKNILKGERTALNILQRMSGIATNTKKFVELARTVNPSVTIAATRKTTPGFRYYEKKAVEIGGGWTHRINLSDGILIKDNHIAISGIENIIEKNRTYTGKLFREIEITSLDQIEKIIHEPFDIIMLDNFTVEMAEKAYTMIKGTVPNIKIEISGGINEENIAKYARYADIISIGRLTHSYKSVDISIELG